MRSSPVHERVVIVGSVEAVYTAHESTEVIVVDKTADDDVIDTDLGPASLGRPETSWDPKQVKTIFAQLEAHEREQDNLSEIDQSAG